MIGEAKMMGLCDVPLAHMGTKVPSEDSSNVTVPGAEESAFDI
jgi:hypothetical protein